MAFYAKVLTLSKLTQSSKEMDFKVKGIIISPGLIAGELTPLALVLHTLFSVLTTLGHQCLYLVLMLGSTEWSSDQE